MKWLRRLFKKKKQVPSKAPQRIEAPISVKRNASKTEVFRGMDSVQIASVNGFANLFNSEFAYDEWPKTEDWPDEETFEKIEEKCLPKFPNPTAGFEIYQSIQDPNTPAKEVAKKVMKDPSLVALILRVVNSAHYGFSYEIEDVGRAVVLLGYNEVKSIVLANSINSFYSQDEKSLEAIKHARLVSLIAFQLANKTDGVNAHQVSTFGMLHDIGQNFFEKLKDDLAEFNLSELTSQMVLGIIFIHHWKLPLDFGPWLQKFSQGKEEVEAQVAILGMANYVANLIGKVDLWADAKPPESWFEILNLAGDPKEWFNNKEQSEIMKTLMT